MAGVPEYIKQMLDEYLRNTEWNDCIPDIFQQEMEWSSSWIINGKLDRNSASVVMKPPDFRDAAKR